MLNEVRNWQLDRCRFEGPGGLHLQFQEGIVNMLEELKDEFELAAQERQVPPFADAIGIVVQVVQGEEWWFAPCIVGDRLPVRRGLDVVPLRWGHIVVWCLLLGCLDEDVIGGICAHSVLCE